jgi:hypothetical protein
MSNSDLDVIWSALDRKLSAFHRLGEFFDDRPWPPHYFGFGTEAGQSWYSLGLASGPEAVYQSRHGMEDVVQEAG